MKISMRYRENTGRSAYGRFSNVTGRYRKDPLNTAQMKTEFDIASLYNDSNFIAYLKNDSADLQSLLKIANEYGCGYLDK